MEATRGNPSIALPVVADGQAVPRSGGVVPAAAGRAGGQLPDGVRCAGLGAGPAVLPGRPAGARGLPRTRPPSPRRPLETELNAQADNPLVSPSDGTLVSNGNFHPVLLAIAFDALRVGDRARRPAQRPPASGTCGRPSSRRWPAVPPVFDGPPPDLPGMHLRYAAAAAYARTAPAGGAGQPRRRRPRPGGGGPLHRRPARVRKADEALDLLARHPHRSSCCWPPTSSTCGPSCPALGAGTSALYGSARGAIAALSDRSTDAVHGAVRAVLSSLGALAGARRARRRRRARAGRRPARRARAARRGTPSPARSRSAAPAA